MKKSVFLIICIFLFSAPTFSDGVSSDNSNWGIQPPSANTQNDNTSDEEDEWNRIHDEVIYKKYGSEESPSFLNREEMNPNESDYGYGTPDGEE